jgi:hypothetical protein
MPAAHVLGMVTLELGELALESCGSLLEPCANGVAAPDPLAGGVVVFPCPSGVQLGGVTVPRLARLAHP